MLGSLLLSVFGTAQAQTSHQLGSLPALNLNKKWDNNWSLNTKIESRQFIQNYPAEDNPDDRFDYLLTDLSVMAARKVGVNSRLGGGYLLRLEDGESAHRFMQQFVVVQKLNACRLSHRLLSDQTFSKIENPTFRMRYRITSEIPLNGQAVDPGEFYVKINHEYIFSTQSHTQDLEIRLVPLLGFDITEMYKLELGTDYRLSQFIHDNTRHRYWLSLNFFIEW